MDKFSRVQVSKERPTRRVSAAISGGFQNSLKGNPIKSKQCVHAAGGTFDIRAMLDPTKNQLKEQVHCMIKI